ncbi:MAG TPA: TolC family protein [Solibacterales bacterium]|nr:TolC family protein [Bryobacterales bacterium]
MTLTTHRRALFLLIGLAPLCAAQQTLTWPQIVERFHSRNPTLGAGKLNVDESKALEITAYHRPNPDLTASVDQINPLTLSPFRPLANLLPLVSVNYLHERQHKRELRLESAREGTAISGSQQEDLERTLLFNLRASFVQTLQQKAILALARENLAYYDRVLSVSQDRFKAGDIARVDLDRLQLQRIQYQSDLQTAEVNLRTAKIQLLALIDDRTPVAQFDVDGPFDFSAPVTSLEEARRIALDARPDLKAALQTIEKARTDNRLAFANGSTDPTFGMDLGHNPPITTYFGASVSIPLRIFERNQGEKLRTEIDIHRAERLREASQAQVFSDVDSAYATISSNVTLLQPYKTTYLQAAAHVRETISFAYQHGGVSLLDFLNAQNDYRSIQLNYLNLVGAYLNAANQLNLAVGREVIP